MTYQNVKKFYDLALTYKNAENKEAQISEMQDLMKDFDMNKLTQRGANKYPEYVLKALLDANYNKANKHVEKLLKKSYSVANENPVAVGKDVYLVRSEHGWYDGNRKAKVVSRSQSNTGVWSYQVKMYDDNNVLSNYKEDVGHTRDMLVAS